MQEQDQAEWQAPPPPEQIVTDPPKMTEAATLGNIFFEPGNTFDDLRRKPRFVMAAIIMALLITAFSFAFYYKVGDEGFREFFAAQIDKSPQASAMGPEQRESSINMGMTITGFTRYATPLLVLISFAVGGLIYWLAGKAFGGSGNFLHGLSTWVYASFPPTLVAMIANFITLIFKNPDDIDIATSQTGVVQANLSLLVNAKESPVLAALLGSVDFFLIWGWILAAIGLQRTMRISAGSAWAVTIILALIGITFKVVGAAFS